MQHPVFVDFASRLPEDLKTDFLRVAELIGSTLPIDAVFADMGGSPEKMRANTISNETLQHTILTTVKLLMESDTQMSPNVITEMLSMAEPFRSNREFTEEILSKMLKEYSNNDYGPRPPGIHGRCRAGTRESPFPQRIREIIGAVRKIPDCSA
jgi:hypothetical protein